MKRFLCFALAVGVSWLGLATASRAFVFIGPSWPGGALAIHLQLGPSPPLQDGSPDWDSSASVALQTWNSHISSLQFAPVPASSAPLGPLNGFNNVFGASSIYGQGWGSGTLAVTLTWSIGGQTLETDVLFNAGLSWDSYPGPLQGSLIDFRRVAMHEFGHVLGLGHPDQGGQSVPALMNSQISNLDQLTQDDISGAQALYGSSAPPLPTHTLTIVKDGTGTGTVTSSPSGITCGSSCSATFDDATTISLTATADQGSTFVGASGGPGCSTGTIELTADVTCTMTFALAGPPPPPPGSNMEPIVDFNSDGRGDSFRYFSSGSWTIDIEDGALSSETPAILTPANSSSWSPGWQIHSADFNADGRTDLFLYNPTSGHWFKAISDGNLDFVYFGGTWSPGWSIDILDLNGDSRSDVFVYNELTGQWFGCASVGDGTGGFAHFGGTWSPGWVIQAMNIDNDAHTDLVVYSPGSGDVYFAYSTGSNDFSLAKGFWGTGWTIFHGDFNGDDWQDLFAYSTTTGEWWMNRYAGAGYVFSEGVWSPGWEVDTGDFNGNGRTDLLLYNETSGHWFIGFSDGAGNFTFVGGEWSPGWSIWVTNFNNDSLADLLFYDALTGAVFQGVNDGSAIFSYVGANWGAGGTIVARGPAAPYVH